MTTLREAYDMVDRFLRNNLCDDGYADYSEALELLSSEPPKREWQGLTDEELHEIREWQQIQKELGPVWAPMMMYLYLAIEAKLKEKNT